MMGETQKSLSEFLGVSVDLVKAWEQGKAYPQFYHMHGLVVAKGITLDFIYFGIIDNVSYSVTRNLIPYLDSEEDRLGRTLYRR